MKSRGRWCGRVWAARSLVALVGLGGGPLGCKGMGTIGPGETPGGPGVVGPGSPTDTGGTMGPSGAGGAPVVIPPGGPMPTTPADPNAAGPRPLRRLSNREYNNTVRDLLGDTTAPANQFPADRDETFLFPRAAAISLQDAKLLRTAAEALAGAATGKLATLLPCNPATDGEQPCARKFIDSFGLRAFRRPLTQAESDSLAALYAKGRDTIKLSFNDAIGLLIEAVLQSPAFLYHVEAAAAPVREGEVLQLGHYEMASRLSYFLWGSMPDGPLFTAAAGGQLGTVAEVEAQATRMLADPRARATLAGFFEGWLELGELASKDKDTKVYPEYNEALRQAMTAETRSFAENVVFDGDGRWGTLLGASYSFVNQALGGVYGLPEVRGTALQRADLRAGERAGFLTQASFLALTGAADGSHPVRRGKAIYEKVLCGELPPPPANVQPAKPASAGGTTRERFAEHDNNECARACHGAMDPIGFAFEHYDGIGKYRTMDNGKPVDASGALELDGATKTFANAVELAAVLAASGDARRCFAMQWARFALQRNETEADRASIEATTAMFRGDATVRELIVATAKMRSFRYRSASPGEVLP